MSFFTKSIGDAGRFFTTFSVDRLRQFLDLEQGCVVAGAPLVVHMKALCSCTPLTVSSPPTAF